MKNLLQVLIICLQGYSKDEDDASRKTESAHISSGDFINRTIIDKIKEKCTVLFSV